MKPLILRGKLLEFLRDLYPEGADERTIVGVFYEYHEYDDIIASLSYLADKGYAECKEVPHPYKSAERIRIYKIAPPGIDLMDGTTVDPAVTIVPEGK
jgi:hypothetical protein